MSENGQAKQQQPSTVDAQKTMDEAQWVPVLRKISAEVDDYPFATAGKAAESNGGEVRKREIKKDRVWFINLKAPSEAVALASKLMDAPED